MASPVMFKITADDFGYCAERNRGILELVSINIVQNVSVIVNGSCAVKFNDGFDVHIGLHLNLTEGIPISIPQNIPTLLEKDHMFLGKFGFRKRLADGTVRESEITTEIEGQINKFISIFGHTPHYVDGHQHVHILPLVRDCFNLCMSKYGIRETRIPYEIGLSRCDWIDRPRFDFYEEVCKQAKEASEYFRTEGIMYPKYFIGLSTMSQDMSIQRFQRSLDLIYNDMKSKQIRFSSRFIEFMVHPGYPSTTTDGGCGNGPDEFSCSLDRLHELEILKSPQFKQMIQKYGKLLQEELK